MLRTDMHSQSPLLLPRTQELEFVEWDSISEGLDFIKTNFRISLEPIYGDQRKALAKITAKQDRNCELLLEKGAPVGILNYKTKLTHEFEEFCESSAFEIKSLFLSDPHLNSRKGLASVLLLRASHQANQLEAQSICVTVSSAKKDSLNFFARRGFKIAHQFCDKHKEGIDEFFLVHKDPLFLERRLHFYISSFHSQKFAYRTTMLKSGRNQFH